MMEKRSLEFDFLPDLAREFGSALVAAHIHMGSSEVRRFISCMLSKNFLIITGLSGSGKTKLAQSFARWITPGAVAKDPFTPGYILKSASNLSYEVVDANEGVIVFRSADGTLTPLPRMVLNEWADYIEANNIPESVSVKKLRDDIRSGSKIYAQLHQIESHYKPAAFALVDARKKAHGLKAYEIVPVGADWTGNDSVLGYPDGLNKGVYVSTPTLDLLLQAKDYPDIPHFLILDEMNLSHVERYFSAILSAIESGEPLSLHGDNQRHAGTKRVPGQLDLPRNLFIVGTVNIDETTYMFSPKVLDRANVIEFRVESRLMREFMSASVAPDMFQLDGKGIRFGKSFGAVSKLLVNLPDQIQIDFKKEILQLFELMATDSAEFGYRTVHEAARYIFFYRALGNAADDNQEWFREAFDSMIIQKILPKLHGTRSKLGPLLKLLWTFCFYAQDQREGQTVLSERIATTSSAHSREPSTDRKVLEVAHYPLSSGKIARMWRLLNENGFASFSEA